MGRNCSKYPPMFGIDIRIDDAEGVKIEAERNEFNVIIIDAEEENWVESILQGIGA